MKFSLICLLFLFSDLVKGFPESVYDAQRTTSCIEDNNSEEYYYRSLSENVKCGIPNTVKRVANGKGTIPSNKYSWVVRIYKKDQYCTGSIIYENVVVTAAHCVLMRNISHSQITDIRVISVGVGGLTSTDEHELRVNVSKIIIPEEPYTRSSDIALLFLSKPLNLSEGKIRNICLPQPSCDIHGELIYAGWGLTSNGKYADTIQEGKGYMSKENSKSALICMETTAETSSIRPGDSGGPLMKLEKDRYVLVGIMSEIVHGLDCSVNLLNHIKWISYQVLLSKLT